VSDSEPVTVDDLHEFRELLTASPDAASLRPIGLHEIVRGYGAVRTLPQILDRLGVPTGARVTVLSDTTPKSYNERDVLDVVLETLGGTFDVELLRLAPAAADTGLVADETTLVSAVSIARSKAPDALVSVGSGTIVDMGKVIANELSLSHVVVQTAASVNGFADDQSVLLINGVKRTTPSRWPDCLVIDPWVVAQAPVAMTQSGLGDQLSMFSAAADWYLSCAVGFDTSYSSTLTSLMRRDIDDLLLAARNLAKGDVDAVNLLASHLAVGGMSMGVAGRTAPSSGTEHLVSHLLEMHADAFHTESASHGSQVGVSSVLAALIWQQIRERLSLGDVTVTLEDIGTQDRVLVAFSHLDKTGKLAQECWAAYERKATWIKSHIDNFRQFVREWPRHDAIISQLLKPAALISSTLRSAQAPATFSQLVPAPSDDVVAWSVTNGYLMRDRFSVVDFAVLVGAWNSKTIAAVLSQLSGLAQ
jgi:glycerol-1-phosphate dehydrogenase [NAD(P)+]